MCNIGDGGVLLVIEVLGLLIMTPALDDGRSTVHVQKQLQLEGRHCATHVNRLVPRDLRCHIGSVVGLHVAEARVGRGSGQTVVIARDHCRTAAVGIIFGGGA